MTDSFIRLPLDGAGKATRTTEVTIGTNLVHEQVVQLADTTDSKINPATEDTLSSMKTIQTDGTQKTQVTSLPAITGITGTVTANAGTNLNTSLLATESTLSAMKTIQTDGTQKTQVTTLPVDETTSGNLSSGESQAYLLTYGFSSVSWQITGTWTGTLYFEKSLDNVTWFPMHYQSGTGVVTEIIGSSANGIYYSALGSTQRIRIRRGAGTGTLAFSAAKSVGEKAVGIISSIPSGNNNIGDVDVATLPSSVISTGNSSTTPLSGGATFTGTAELVDAYASVLVTVIASQGSSNNGMMLQFSSNGTAWDSVVQTTISAGAPGFRAFSPPTRGRYFRVMYTNGAASQSYFRLQTIYSMTRIPTGLPVDIPLTSDMIAQVVQSVLNGRVKTTVTTSVANGALTETRHDAYSNVVAVTAQNGGGTNQIATESTLASGFESPYYLKDQRAVGIKGAGYWFENDKEVYTKIASDDQHNFTITASGVYPINKLQYNTEHLDITDVDFAGCNQSSDAEMFVNVYYWSENDGAYVVVGSACLPSVETPQDPSTRKLNKFLSFPRPKTATWNSTDSMWGYVEVINLTSGSENFYLQVNIGSYEWW